jgi:hypothetical protein
MHRSNLVSIASFRAYPVGTAKPCNQFDISFDNLGDTPFGWRVIAHGAAA